MLVLFACKAESDSDASGPGASREEGAWTIDGTPVFSISAGSFEGDSIFFTPLIHAALSRDGEVVVTTGGEENKVILLDPTGHITAVLGGKGEGPDQFRSGPVIVASSGDRTVVADLGPRILREVRGGKLGAGWRYEAAGDYGIAAAFEDGTAVTAPRMTVPIGGKESDYTDFLGATPYLLWRGESADTLWGPSSPPRAAFPAFKQDGALYTFIPGRTGCLPRTQFTTRGSRLYIADAASGTVTALDRSGTLDTLFHTSERRRVTEEMIDSARARLDRADATPAKGFFERLGEVGDPLPAAWSEVVWHDEMVWLRQADLCFTREQPDPALWTVVDLSSGSRVATFELPAKLRLHAVNGDRVLAEFTDDLGVEFIGVYRLDRGATP